MAVHSSQLPRRSSDTNSGALTKAAALLLGLLAGTLAVVAVLMWADAGRRATTGRLRPPLRLLRCTTTPPTTTPRCR
jgi:hypothetical protein